MVRYPKQRRRDLRFFTSDTHFYHRNILHLCKRPFSSLDEMHDEITQRWNSVVGPDDEVFHLGDFCYGAFGSKVKTRLAGVARSRLNGKITLVSGNHDKGLDVKGIFGHDKVALLGIDLDGVRVRLQHRPPSSEEIIGMETEAVIHGHLHNNTQTGIAQFLNVSVEMRDYRPISEIEVLEELRGQGWQPRKS